MPSETRQEQQPEETVRPEETNAFRAGYMAGYTNDNPAADPSLTGFFAGYVGPNADAPQPSEEGAQ